MKITRRPMAVLLTGALGLVLCDLPSESRADGVSEMTAFSAFDNVDLSELAKSDVKTAKGVPMDENRFLSVQSCYVTPGNPEQQIAALHQWDPLKHKELKVYVHGDIKPNIGASEFLNRLKKAPDNSSVRSLVAATTKMGSEVQISKEEAKKFSEAGGGGGGGGGGGVIPANVASFWADLLNTRFHLFLSGGAAAQPSYDHTGDSIQSGREFSALLGAQAKIHKQFAGFLARTGVGHSGGTSPDLYWELLDVDGKGVLTMGASYAHSGGPYQAADVLYYASGGYYVGLTLYQMWPVTVDGKPSTLVWRGDMISSPEIASLHGVERLASESAMMKDIAKGVALFRRDSERSR
jgi:hypothetical protein